MPATRAQIAPSHGPLQERKWAWACEAVLHIVPQRGGSHIIDSPGFELLVGPEGSSSLVVGQNSQIVGLRSARLGRRACGTPLARDSFLGT